MCGRFFRHKVSWEDYHAQLNLFKPEEIPEITPAYNVAPTQKSPIIRRQENGEKVELAMAVFGLVPRWWKKPLSEKKFATFNSKSEESHDKATFRASWKDRPCLVPMSGFYEWKGPKGDKQPYAISMRNRRWFYVAGLWDRTVIDDQALDSFTILTTTANEFMSDIHHRMPVIPEQSEALSWLNATVDERRSLTTPYQGDDMYAWKVGRAVGNVCNQGEKLIEEIDT